MIPPGKGHALWSGGQGQPLAVGYMRGRLCRDFLKIHEKGKLIL